MPNEYKTVLNFAEEVFIDKKSKFIAAARPIYTEEDALLFINERKSKYSDATHNVYAYLVCGENVFQRFSDDGEPSGTAGLPVLEVIKKLELKNIVIVVTRYFGGTLLGAAGLIRAYGKSAFMAVEKAKIVKKILCREVQIIIDYSLLGKVQNLFISKGYNVKNIIYGQSVEMLVYVPHGGDEIFIKLLNEATNANVIIDLKEQHYITLDDEDSLVLL